MTTIGGGLVLDPDAPRLRRNRPEPLARLADLDSADPVRRASAAVYFAGLRPWEPEDLARTAGVDDGHAACQALAARGEVVRIDVSPTRRTWVHRAVLDDLAGQIEGLLRQMHAESPLLATLDRSRLAGRLPHPPSEAVLEAVLQSMAAAGRIELGPRDVALAGQGPQLSSRERELVERIVETYRDAGFQPPTVDEVRGQTARNQAAVPELIRLAAAQGRLVRISPGLYLHAEAERQMRTTLAERLRGGPGLTVSQIREILGTTRKYAVPFCEHLDRTGFSKRQGDLRVLAGG